MNLAPIVPSELSDDAKIERLEGAMLECPQVECPVEHFFGPGIYIRHGLMPAGALVVGQRHKHPHLNVMLQGRCVLATDDGVMTLEAPRVFVSAPGRKVFFILEDTVWQNVYATELRDLAEIEEAFIEKSPTWLAHHDAQLALEAMRENKILGTTESEAASCG